MFDTSQISISRSALQTNLRFLKQRIGPHVKFCSIVKGNAYGHGLAEFTRLAMECGVNYFGVYAAGEAYDLVKSVEQKPELYIMGYAEEDAIEWAIHEGIEFCVFDAARLEQAFRVAKKLKKKARVHLEVETGMNRTGFEEKDLVKAGEFIEQHQGQFEVKGVCTHFAGAESMANNFRVSQQISRFYKALLQLGRTGIKPQYQHAACSAGVMNYPETIGNMVRVGIMQYGFWPNDETFIRYNGDKERNSRVLKRLMRWQSRIMSIKQVKKSEFIGYGTSYLAHRDMKVAVVPVGYSHGYSRSLSNTGRVLIRGVEAPVTGIVNMNAITVDVTHIDGVEKGDEVVLIGTQKNKTISVVSFSELSHQLNYEMLTRIPDHIPRILVD